MNVKSAKIITCIAGYFFAIIECIFMLLYFISTFTQQNPSVTFL